MAHGSVPAAEIAECRKQWGLSQAELAFALGVAKRTVEEWEKAGSTRAPGYLRLALAALDRGIPPWRSGRVP